MPYPDDFSSARFDAAMGKEPSRAADQNGAAADAASKILQDAIDAIRAIPTPPGPRTAELLDEAAAWLDEHCSAIRTTASAECSLEGVSLMDLDSADRADRTLALRGEE